MTAWRPGPSLITPSKSITPKVMRLTWNGYPLHKIKGHGWGFLIPGREECLDWSDEVAPSLESLTRMCPKPTITDGIGTSAVESEKRKAKTIHSVPPPEFYKGAGLFCPEVNIPGVWFYRLPHPADSQLKVNI